MVDIKDVPSDYSGNKLGDHEAWELIKAAIGGNSIGDSQQIAGYCDPFSLEKAAKAFQLAADTFRRCHIIFAESSKSIAGPDRVWQGPAADAFLDRMQAHAKLMEKHYQTITGWSGKIGTEDIDHGRYSIVTSLIQAGDKMLRVQKAVDEIVKFHGSQALERGAPRKADGQVDFTGDPEVLTVLNNDMTRVFSALQNNYSDNQRNLRPATAGNLPSPNTVPSTSPSSQNGAGTGTFGSLDSLGKSKGLDLGDSGSGLSGSLPWGDDGPASYDPSLGSTGSFGASGWSGDTPAGWAGFDSGTNPSWGTGVPGSADIPAWGAGLTDPSTVSTGVSSLDPYTSTGYSGGTGSYGGAAGGTGTGGVLGSGSAGSSGFSAGRGNGSTGPGGYGGALGAGMPYGMGPGAGAGGQGGEERERSTWLVEDESIWGTDPQLPPEVLGR